MTDGQRVSAFEFKDLTILHRLGLRPAEYRLVGDDDNWRIRWFPVDEIASWETTARLRWIRVGLLPATGYKLSLYLQEGLFQVLLQGIEPTHFWQLNATLRCAYFQVNNQGVLDWVGQHWQCAVRIESVDLLQNEPDFSQAAAFALTSVLGLYYQPGLIELADAEQHYSLSSLFSIIPSGKINIDIDIPLHLDIIVGQTQVPLVELQGLQRNDLVLLDAGEFSCSRANLCLQNRLLFVASIEQNLLHVEQLFRPDFMANTDTFNTRQTSQSAASVVEEGVNSVTNDTVRKKGLAEGQGGKPSPTDKPAQHINPNGVDVLLYFSLGSVTRTLAELEEIGEGYVFELPTQPANCVDIHVNDKRLARGELVRVEERVGIRIVSIESG